MDLLGSLLDSYSRQARLAPALIVFVPGLLIAIAWFPDLIGLGEAFATLIVSCGLVVLLAQLGRERGRRLEPELYERWGGKPSVAWMRPEDTHLDRYTKKRYRQYAIRALPEVTFPDLVVGSTDFRASDEAYEALTRWLVGQTRDRKRFELLFRENVSYGFRRNIWGLKPFGLGISIVSLLAGVIACAFSWQHDRALPTPGVDGAMLIVAGLTLVWLFVVNDRWVKSAADAYASQLLAACDAL